MLSFLVILTVNIAVNFSIHQRLALPLDKKNPYILPMTSLHYKQNGDIEISRVPSISDDKFFELYSKYNGSLPVLERDMRQSPQELCGKYPDYFDFFRLPKSQHSRLFEDKIIYDAFFKPNAAQAKQGGTPSYGTYVELGAFDGREESNTIFFDTCLGWDGLLIEATAESYQKVIENRPNAVKLSFSPTCHDSVSKDGNQQTTSFYNIPLSNNGMKDLAISYSGKDTVEVPCGPFTPVLLDIFGTNRTISFLSLDVEGAESLVLETVDFAKLDIHVVMIEIQNKYCQHPLSCRQTHMIRQRMAESNYALYADFVEASDVYVKHGTEASRRGKRAYEQNAQRQWILKKKMLLKEKKEAHVLVG